jgi:hypothetical protein
MSASTAAAVEREKRELAHASERKLAPARREYLVRRVELEHPELGLWDAASEAMLLREVEGEVCAWLQKGGYTRHSMISEDWFDLAVDRQLWSKCGPPDQAFPAQADFDKKSVTTEEPSWRSETYLTWWVDGTCRSQPPAAVETTPAPGQDVVGKEPAAKKDRDDEDRGKNEEEDRALALASFHPERGINVAEPLFPGKVTKKDATSGIKLAQEWDRLRPTEPPFSVVGLGAWEIPIPCNWMELGLFTIEQYEKMLRNLPCRYAHVAMIVCREDPIPMKLRVQPAKGVRFVQYTEYATRDCWHALVSWWMDVWDVIGFGSPEIDDKMGAEGLLAIKDRLGIGEYVFNNRCEKGLLPWVQQVDEREAHILQYGAGNFAAMVELGVAQMKEARALEGAQ